MYIFNTLGSCYCLLKQWSAYIINNSAYIRNVWGYTEIFPTFSNILSGRKKSDVDHCMGIDLSGEVGEICNIFVFFGREKQKQKQNKSEIDLCGSSAWNAPCVAKK